VKSKEAITFDKIDYKCYEELPLLVDILASTLNKIGKLFSVYQQELLTIVKKELKGKRGWSIKKVEDALFYPFNFDGKRELTFLQQYIDTSNGINIVKRHGNNINNRFWVYSGLTYENTEGEKRKYFHFSIERIDVFVKRYGTLYPKAFYNNLSKKVKDLNCEYWHPDVEGNSEEIYLWCDELDTDKLNEYYERFKTNIVIPYIKSLE
jgi:hypothetical protein